MWKDATLLLTLFLAGCALVIVAPDYPDAYVFRAMTSFEQTLAGIICWLGALGCAMSILRAAAD